MGPKQGESGLQTHGEILSHLRKVLATPLFQRAEKQRRFLQYVVEQTLAGETGALKEAQIGCAVYGRPADYDPKTDPIVRVEASRLRARLREYYEEDGAADEIRIQLAKGGYTAQFVTPLGEVTLPEAVPPPSPEPLIAESPTRRSRWKLALAAAALLLLPLAAWWKWGSGAAAHSGSLDSVGILPFTDLSPVHDQGFLCEGLSEQITDELTRIAGLRVAGRSSMARFRDSALDPKQIGAELGVAALLQGSVGRNGDRVRVTVRLTDAATGYQIWSDTFEGQAGDFFALQDDISRNVARRLEVKLAESVETKAARYAPQRLEAHRLFVRARAIHRMGQAGNYAEALRLHEQAVAADPTYALAHSGLAHMIISAMGLVPGDPNQMRQRAFAEAKRALDLDPGLADGHSAIIRYYRDIERDYASADSACHTAMRQFPNVAGIQGSCGGVLELLGRQQEAVLAHERSVALDPLWAGGLHALSAAYYRAGRFDDALRTADRLQRIAPEYVSIYAIRALTYAAQNLEGKALATIQEGETRGAAQPEFWIGLRGYLAARGGRTADARRLLAELAVLRKRRPASHLYDCWILLGLKDIPGATGQIRTATDNDEDPLLFGVRDWILKPLWENPATRPAMERAAHSS